MFMNFFYLFGLIVKINMAACIATWTFGMEAVKVSKGSLVKKTSALDAIEHGIVGKVNYLLCRYSGLPGPLHIEDRSSELNCRLSVNWTRMFTLCLV